jgi:membrane protein
MYWLEPDKRAVQKTIMWSVLKTAVSDWFRHKSSRLGAALAYYSVFSLGPLLLIVTSVAGLFFGADAVRGALSAQFRSLLGETGSQAVEAMLAGASSQSSGILAAIFGIVLLLVAALGVVVQLKDALNTIWETKDPEGVELTWYVRTYGTALAGILALGFLLAVSLVITTGLTAFSNWLGGSVAESALWQGLEFVVSLAILTALFALLFKFLPDAELKWNEVWQGALTTAVLFQIGKFAISWYVGSQGLESTYGAAASIVILLVWVYYSAQIVLFGAEITHVLSSKRHSMQRKGRPQHKQR